ncbi:MAG: hypothetical protein WD342_16865 [Verrucomicrobiales bacterium]
MTRSPRIPFSTALLFPLLLCLAFPALLHASDIGEFETGKRGQTLQSTLRKG